MILISDIHGCFVTLTKLLSQFPGEQVYFLGDLIDRGPDSAAVVRYAMENKILTLMGNHEQLCLSAYNRRAGESYRTWINNGGHTTEKSFGGKVPSDVLDWMEKLPLFIQFEPEGLLLSHTGWGNCGNEWTALWSRNRSFPKDGLFRVFGHTPSEEPVCGKEWVNIDTGCAYPAYGHLTALQWPSGQLITIPNCEPEILT